MVVVPLALVATRYSASASSSVLGLPVQVAVLPLTAMSTATLEHTSCAVPTPPLPQSMSAVKVVSAFMSSSERMELV